MDTSQLPLRDIHLPEPIGWWPLAYGWWLLLVLIMACACGIIWWVKRRKADPRRYALQSLNDIERQYASSDKSPNDDQATLIQCNILLKRTALSMYPHEDIARLSGTRWVSFLKQHSQKTDDDLLNQLVTGPYQASSSASNIEISRLIQFTRQWVRHAGKGAKSNV